MADPSPNGLLPRDIIKPDDQSTWELAWSMGVSPWDFGDVQPSLREAVESSGLDLPRSGRALVPGCGAGYDVTYLAASLGLDSLGLDIANTALTRGTEVIRLAKEKNPNIKAAIETTDFFTFDPPKDQLFDLIMDHTFFVAIPPTMRPKWAEQMIKLIKPGGYLITLVFPLRPYDETGPPYYVEPEHYVPLLGAHFTKVLDKTPDISSPSHVGKERLVVWKRL